MKMKILLPMLISTLTFLSFQNCSKVAFSDVPIEVSSMTEDDIPAVDPQCTNPDPDFNFYPPATALKPLELDANCRNGFEVNNLDRGTLTLSAVTLSQQHRAVVEVATYAAPDNVQIYAVDAAGVKKTIFHTCLMQTWERGDPTGGLKRPPDDTIRQFRIVIPAGTKKLMVDNTRATSPTYIRFAGLCDFDTAANRVNWSTTGSYKRYLPGSY